MKISNEVKIGIITLTTIVSSIILFSFLKGNNVFKSTVNYYVVYENVGGLAESSPVEVNGFQVGIVQDIHFIDANSGKLVVVLSVDKDFKLPVNTVAEIKPVSIIAGMKIQLIYGDGIGFYEEKDTLTGQINTSIITTLEEDIDPILKNVTSVLANLDSVANGVALLLSSDFIVNLNNIAANLESTTATLDNLIADKEKEIDNVIDNLEVFTSMLSDNSENFSEIFSNLESITDTIAFADLSSTISGLKNTLEETSLLLKNLNSGKGSAGQFVADEDLYNNINSTVVSLNNLLEDLNSNPKKYVHFSLFGKKESSSE